MIICIALSMRMKMAVPGMKTLLSMLLRMVICIALSMRTSMDVPGMNSQ